MMRLIITWNIIFLFYFDGVLSSYVYRTDMNMYDEDCHLDSTTEKIQLAFVADNTFSNRDFVKQLSNAVISIMDRLNDLHDETEFAIATHANWPQDAFMPDGVENVTGHREPEACHDRRITFTTDEYAITNAARDVNFIFGPTTPDESEEENGVSAIAFAAADDKLGWVRTLKDEEGRRVHRFIVLLTDKYGIFSLPIPGNRTEFRGDGTDTCSTSLPPSSLEQVRRVLEEKDCNVIGAYFKEEKSRASYVTEFKNAEFSNRHCYAEKVFMSKSEFAKDLGDLVYNCVRMFLRCAFTDPPNAYNTLGL